MLRLLRPQIIFLALFATSHLYKGYVEKFIRDTFGGAPNLTFLTWGLCCLVMMYFIVFQREEFRLGPKKFLAFLLALIALLVFSLCYSPYLKVALVVLSRAIFFEIFALFIILNLLRTQTDIEDYIRVLAVTVLVFCVVVTGFTLSALITDPNQYISTLLMSVEGDDAVAPNRISAAWSVSYALIFLIVARDFYQKRVWSVSVFSLGIFLVCLNSKGPVFGFCVAMGLYFFLYKRNFKILLKAGLALIALLVTLVLVLPETVYFRYIEFFTGAEQGGEAARRWWLIKAVAEHADENFFLGGGFFSFPTIWDKRTLPIDEKVIFDAHPHNVFVELFMHAGFLAPLLFAAILLSVLIPTYRHAKTNVAARAAFLGAIAILICQQFSGNLAAIRPLFLALGFCLATIQGASTKDLVD